MAIHIIMVEVPVKAGLALFHQRTEQLLFHLLQQVEAYEQIMAMGGLFLLFFYDLTIKGTLVSQPLLAQPVVEIVVDISKMAP